MFESYFRRIGVQPVVLALLGVLEALVLARLAGRLFAARPDHVVFTVLYNLTDPLVVPLAFLDAGQPRYGAVLEFSALTLALLVPLVAGIVWWFGSRRGTARRAEVHITNAR